MATVQMKKALARSKQDNYVGLLNSKNKHQSHS